jgi:serine/threonine-protein kinase
LAKSAVQTFGKYQILERIATGGMAEIYKARLEGIGGFQRTFAIKRILPHLSQNAEYVAMLVDEAKVAGLLSHANIVQILDLGQVDGVWYIAMEYVHGPDLGAVLRRCRSKGIQLPVPHTVFVALELLKGLEYAHQRQVMRGGRPVPLNIIHRDVSPPNVLLSMQGEVKLTDFGIARASHKALETATGVIKGRFDYMSPEQAGGARDLDQRSDLFSVGVVLYEMLTGVHPFRGDSELGTIDRVRTGRYEPASVVNPGVPFTLETIVDRALRVDRNERYPNATAFKEALDKFFHDAGFIFTHHSLAAYVRGLFPDDELGGAATEPPPLAPPAGPEPDDLELDADDDSVEGPTRVIDKAKVGNAAAVASLFGLKTDDTATLVRKANPAGPGGWEEEPETVVRRAGAFEEDVPTTTSTDATGPPAPPRNAQLETLVRRTPPELSSPPDVATEPPAPREPTRKPPSRPPQPAPAASARRGGSVVILAGVAAILTFLVGLFVGTVVGVVVGQALDLGAAPPPDPVLQVQAPVGSTVTVDGQRVAGAVPLAPGVPHAVEVAGPNQPTVQTNIVLQPGEVRVLIVAPLAAGDAP